MNFNYTSVKNDNDLLDILDNIMQTDTFVTVKDTEEIYYYDKSRGIFVNQGDKLI